MTTTDKPSAGELAELLARADEYLNRIPNKGNCGPHHLVSDLAAALRPPVAGAEVADEGSLLSEASKRYPQLGGSHREAFIEGARWAASVLADSYDPEINIKAASALCPVAERDGGEIK